MFFYPWAASQSTASAYVALPHLRLKVSELQRSLSDQKTSVASEWFGLQPMFPLIVFGTEQISGLLSANLNIVKILCDFQCVFTVNTEAVPTLSYTVLTVAK